MKMRRVLISILLLVLFAIKLLFFPKIDYPVGKDTIHCFANGRFQILRSYAKKNQPLYALHDVKDDYSTLLSHVRGWRRRWNFVYAVSATKGVVVIDLGQSDWNWYKDIDDAPREHQGHLRDLLSQRQF